MTFFSGLFCGGGGCEMRRQLPSGVRSHRPAEVVSSQGGDGYGAESSRMPLPPRIVQAWSPTRAPWGRGGGGGGSFSAPHGLASTHSVGVNDVLGGHLPCTAAALGSQENALPGRGLYVAMQRGMSYDTNGLHDRPAMSSEMPSTSSREASPRVLHRKLAKIRAESPGRMIPAENYRGCPDDAIDEAVAAECLLLPRHHAKALLIRRIAPGEYEVDGVPVRFTYSKEEREAAEVMVSTPGLEHEGMEPLSRYLPRAAEQALARAPIDLELPAFPWPWDLLSKSTPNVDLLSKSTPNVPSVSNIKGTASPDVKGINATLRDALSVSNVSNMVPEQHMNPLAKTSSQMPVVRKSPSMLETTSYMGPPQAGPPVAGPAFSATIPIGGNSRARCIPHSPSHYQSQSMFVPPGKVAPRTPVSMPRPPGYLSRR